LELIDEIGRLSDLVDFVEGRAAGDCAQRLSFTRRDYTPE
jgi:hypothetical protein